jgi:hypothetical protein
MTSMTGPEPTSRIEGFARKHYLPFMFLIIAAVAVFGIITMQLLVSLLVIIGILGVILIIEITRRSRLRRGDPARNPEAMDEGTAVIAAVIIAFIGVGVSTWLVWVVALAVLFLIQQSLARIERRLDLLEYRDRSGGSDPMHPTAGQEETQRH